LLFLIISFGAGAQSSRHKQLANEVQFARAINDKWAVKAWVAGFLSNTHKKSLPEWYQDQSLCEPVCFYLRLQNNKKQVGNQDTA
jgi:hypothetical protein